MYPWRVLLGLWRVGELIINLGDCLGTIPLHERLTSTTLPWNCVDSI